MQPHVTAAYAQKLSKEANKGLDVGACLNSLSTILSLVESTAGTGRTSCNFYAPIGYGLKTEEEFVKNNLKERGFKVFKGGLEKGFTISWEEDASPN